MLKFTREIVKQSAWAGLQFKKVLMFSGAGWMLHVLLWFWIDSCFSQVGSSAEEQPPRVLYPWRNQGKGLARVKRDWIIPQIRVLENSKQVPEALVQVKMSSCCIIVKYKRYTAAKASKICSDWGKKLHISLQIIMSLTWFRLFLPLHLKKAFIIVWLNLLPQYFWSGSIVLSNCRVFCITQTRTYKRPNH